MMYFISKQTYRVQTLNCRRYILEPGGSHMHLTEKNEVSLEPHSPLKDFDIFHVNIGQSQLKILWKIWRNKFDPSPTLFAPLEYYSYSLKDSNWLIKLKPSFAKRIHWNSLKNEADMQLYVSKSDHFQTFWQISIFGQFLANFGSFQTAEKNI